MQAATYCAANPGLADNHLPDLESLSGDVPIWMELGMASNHTTCFPGN